jgi:hypothetical protein
MHRSGKLVLLGMLLIGVGLAGFAVWHRYANTRQALAFWGPQAAELISTADGAELLVLEPQGESSGTDEPAIEHAGRPFTIRRQYDLSKVRGLAHLRAALVEDSSFDWSGAQACDPRWTHGLRFFENGHETVVLLDLECGRATSAESDEGVSIEPIAAGLKEFIEEASG